MSDRTDYQRGHRDALLALADTLEERHPVAERTRMRSVAVQVLARLRRAGLSLADARALSRALALSSLADGAPSIARRMSEGLPMDPETDG